MYDVIIIGAGPAGLFVATQLKNVRIAVLEKGETCARKLLLTGAGKCNLTHTGDIRDFISHFNHDAAKFLRYALKEFDNSALQNWFSERGINFITDENGKIFPASMRAQDVLNVLLNECKSQSVKIFTNTTVSELSKQTDDSFVVKTNNCDFLTKQVVIATGGASFPITGSTGDGQVWAKKLGHKIIPMKPALTPIKAKNYALVDLAGQSFENLFFTHWRNGKKIGTYTGDVLFTHSGVSGPGILNSSRFLTCGDVLKLCFTCQNAEQARENLLAKLSKGGSSLVKTQRRELSISKRFVEKILEFAKINENLKCAELKKDKRTTLLKLLTEYEIEIKELGNFNVAMATAGGVSLNEISPKTMQSRIVNNLYLIGEVIDVDGDTGGYNLQAAMSMAFVCAKAILSHRGE